jgi:hypothetical protein
MHADTVTRLQRELQQRNSERKKKEGLQRVRAWNRDREPPVRGEARGHGPSSPRASTLAGHKPLIPRPESSGINCRSRTEAPGRARSRFLRLPPRGREEQGGARNPRKRRNGRSARGGGAGRVGSAADDVEAGAVEEGRS